MLTHQVKLVTFVIFSLCLAGAIAAQEQAEEATEASSEKKSYLSRFKDPEDGMFDMSEWLLENIVGFLPVPIIITEPAVDNGLGAAGVFFHKPKDDQMKPGADGKLILPNVSAVAAAITGNDSWFVGGGHFRNWSKDRYRYNISAGYADINLDWYGGDIIPSEDRAIHFNVKGAMVDQEILFRVRESDWFLGANWQYLHSDVEFKIGLPIELPTVESSVSGIAAIALYENLDYQISPRNGFNLRLEAQFNREAIGSDYHYDRYAWQARQYFEFADKYTLAWRLDGATTSGDVPFYLEPFVEIQGIPAMRYQGSAAATFEVRGGYDVHPRWTVLGFVGGGRAGESISRLADEKTHKAYGVGFRYMIAKKMGMRIGLDVARGPEGTYGYLVMGNAWR